MPKAPPEPNLAAIASFDTALQHGPRPLPLFLSILWRETENNPEMRQLALKGLRRYQSAKRPVMLRAKPKYVAGNRAHLLHVNKNAAINAASECAPVVLIPSLINPSMILDLSETMSLARYLATEGHDVYLMDWGTPTASDVNMGLSDHIEQLLLPLLAHLPRPPVLVGYCLGGTIAIAAAHLHPCVAVATLAAPWNFSVYPAHTRKEIASLWQTNKAAAQALRCVPMEILQSGFWNLDPLRTIEKFAFFADMADGPEADAFIVVEDWANGGAPLTYRAGQELFESLYADNYTERGLWQVGGESVLPSRLNCPSLSIRSTSDKIVPAAATVTLAENSKIALGHVGMIVSKKAPAQLWEPLSQWIHVHKGE
jgi:polyhydroxyalkanoate synthase subunit PhaC